MSGRKRIPVKHVRASSDSDLETTKIVPLSTSAYRPRRSRRRRKPVHRRRKHRSPITDADVRNTSGGLPAYSQEDVTERPAKRRRPSPEQTAYDTVPASDFLGESTPQTPQDQRLPSVAALIGGWPEYVEARTREFKNSLLTGLLRLLAAEDGLMLQMVDMFAGAASLELAQVMRKLTAHEKALLDGLDVTDHMKMTYLVHKNALRPVLHTFDHWDKCEAEYNVFVRQLQGLRKDKIGILNLQRTVDDWPAKPPPFTDPDVPEEEEEGEDDMELAKAKAQLEAASANFQPRVQEFATHFFGPRTDMPFFAECPPGEPGMLKMKYFQAMIGRRMAESRHDLEHYEGSSRAVDRVLEACNVDEEGALIGNGIRAPIGVDPIYNAVVSRLRGMEHRARAADQRVIDRRARDLERRGEFENALMISLEPRARFAYQRALDTFRGLIGEDDVRLTDIARDNSVLIRFAELVGYQYAEKDYDRVARAEGGRYHAARNKDDYLDRRAEVMLWLKRLAFDRTTRKFRRLHLAAGVPLPTHAQMELDSRPAVYPGEPTDAADWLLLMRHRGTVVGGSRRRRPRRDPTTMFKTTW